LLVNQAPNAAQTDSASILIKSDQLARTYADMLVQEPELSEVIATLHLNYTLDDLAKVVRVNSILNTQLLEVDVEDPDPVLAAAIANAIPVAFNRQNTALQASRYAEEKISLTQDMETLNTQIQQAQAKSDTLDASKSAQVDAELVQLRASYSSLRQSYENIRLAESQSTSNIVVTEPARVPTEPDHPKPGRNAVLGGVVGLLLSVGLVFLIGYLDDRIRTPEQIELHLNVPILGLIRRWVADKTFTYGQAALIAVREPRSPIVEAFRSLRTNIQFASVDQQIRTLLVTSASPTEGKSTVAANLAIVMAQAGLRVTLVDCDLRRPTVHKLFEQPDRLGLTNLMLQDPSQWNGAKHVSPIDHLSLITSGPTPPNPSEILGSNRMRQFIEYLHTTNDMVIIDAPPMLAVTDALILSRLADGVLLVVDTGTTRIGDAIHSKQQLDQLNARLLGVVMNKVPTGRQAYYYYYDRG
ncbi:MAG TPA: polysaccharide biosynthesis tyrosine autokinase, partial [Anaerolineae bacterium]|nr:polysaccharide biosynthesis tyrosine autokinase [Anaerolineae bacterium]